ncbi:putative GDP-L-fucose synthase 1 [Iris pallida]|uniref:GDP-L-fucose synthase 1 n=1 Tax=Iris pallida TaxID=29817 RepID=A0AAX6F5G6_IRIPA|nr:putative GDP-L-fucose synthase 1 [Iris pallida]KAJ6811614.1 putative GDP-L-fucose synthase 1 [Iris pallida]
MAIEWNKLIAISSVRVFILKLMELHLKVVLVRICGVLFGFHVFLVVSLKSLVILNIYIERGSLSCVSLFVSVSTEFWLHKIQIPITIW